MSPRKTRRAAKTENVDESVLETTMSSSKTPESPSVLLRSVRTRRQTKPKVSHDSDAEQSEHQSPSLNQTKQSVKKGRGKKANTTADVIDDSINVTATSTRKRGRKPKETAVIIEDSMVNNVDNSEINVSPVKKAKGKKKLATKKVEDNETSSDHEEEGKIINELLREKFIPIENIEVADVIDDSINVTVTSTRKRGRKPKETAVIIEDSMVNNVDNSEINVSPVKKAKGKKKLATKKVEDNETTSGHEEEGKIINELLREEFISIEDNEVADVSEKRNPSPPSNSRFRQLRARNTNSPSVINVTPESSPISVNLTPHRTTKTPRKSPVNIGSPKTHSLSPQKILKTPRKLPVTSASPVPSEQSSSGETPRELIKSSEKKKSAKDSLKVSSPTNFLSSSSGHKFSKTPKIVLRRSKSKSPKSKTPMRTKVRKYTPKKSLTPRKSPVKQRNSPDVKLIEAITKGRSPQLILERVSLVSSPKLGSNIVQSPIKKKGKVNTPIAIDPQKSLEVKIAEKSSPINGPVTPIRPILTSRFHSISKGSSPRQLGASAIQTKLSSSTPREKGRRSLNLNETSLLSVDAFYGSSPRTSTRIHDDKSVRIIDETNPLISEDDSFEISGIKRADDSTFVNENSKDVDKTEVKKNGTYELDEPKTPSLKKKKAENDTYELDEPKTPALKRRAGKRSMDADKKHEPEEVMQKKTFRVRFASPMMDAEKKDINKQVIRSRLATPKHVLMNSTDKASSSHRRRSNSLSNLSVRTPNSGNKIRSCSVVNESRGKSSAVKSQNESVNRLSRPRQSLTAEKKKPENMKPSSARKIPNFAQIHQKKFEKMESLVDVKKRIEDRHIVLTSKIPSLSGSKVVNNGQTVAVVKSTTKTSPKKTVNNSYNRFGFKIRKQEATQQIVSKQPPKKKILAQKEEKRQILKGVRSNRRFELMMKSRNME